MEMVCVSAVYREKKEKKYIYKQSVITDLEKCNSRMSAEKRRKARMPKMDHLKLSF